MRTNPDYSYVAGLYEGEGSIRGGKNKEICIGMTNLQTLEEIRKIMGFGNIYGPFLLKSGKSMYQYKICRVADIQEFFVRIFSRLSNDRREQVYFKLGEDFLDLTFKG